MDLLLLLVLCSLATFYTVESLLRQALRLSPLLSRGCNDSDVLAVAGIALQDVNSDRKDGYVLSLNRVSDVREHRQASDSPLSGAAVCTSCRGQPGNGDPETNGGGALQTENLLRMLCSPLRG